MIHSHQHHFSGWQHICPKQRATTITQNENCLFYHQTYRRGEESLDNIYNVKYCIWARLQGLSIFTLYPEYPYSFTPDDMWTCKPIKTGRWYHGRTFVKQKSSFYKPPNVKFHSGPPPPQLTINTSSSWLVTHSFLACFRFLLASTSSIYLSLGNFFLFLLLLSHVLLIYCHPHRFHENCFPYLLYRVWHNFMLLQEWWLKYL